MRETIDLNGTWRFQPDMGDEGRQAGHFRADVNIDRWREVAVPGCFGAHDSALDFFEGKGWYCRRVEISAAWADRDLVVRCGAVNQRAEVWINGESAGSTVESYLPFEFSIGHLVKLGDENTIVVCVDNERYAEDVPGLDRGWRTYGGILRDIELAARPRARIADMIVDATPDDGCARIRVALRNDTDAELVGELRLQMTDGAGDVVAEALAEAVAAPGESAIAVELSVPGAQAWSPDSPALYRLVAELVANGSEVDRDETRFGFRRIEATAEGLRLNGEPIFLKGFNRHEDAEGSRLARNPESARRDFEDMKAMGANFVRHAHYPHDTAELDLCDELGLLAMEEIPLYWWYGPTEDDAEVHDAKLQSAKRMLDALVARGRNHPSVIFWSVSNETVETNEPVAKGNAELLRHVKALDSTRLAVHVSNHWPSAPCFDDDDVICVNYYPGWSGRGRQDDADYDLSDAGVRWRDALAGLRELYPDKPILVAEFGYPGLLDTGGGTLGDDTQAAVLEAEFAGMDAEYVCGATIWCYADHPWPPFNFLNWLTTSPFGVVTRDRCPKASHAAAKRIFAAR